MSLLLSIAAQRRRASSIDPAITAFATASGATDLTALSNLAAYLRAQSLLPSSRCFPFKAAQNAGSGSTVFGWGDLTSNNATIVNSASWGVSGLTLSRTGSGHIAISDFLPAATTLTMFLRTNITDNSAELAIASQFNFSTSDGSFYFLKRSLAQGDTLGVVRSSNGSTQQGVQGTKTGLGAMNCFVFQTPQGVSGSNVWVNKSQVGMGGWYGSSVSTVGNSSLNIFINSLNGVSFFADQLLNSALFLTGSVTTLQRETITDLINAL